MIVDVLKQKFPDIEGLRVRDIVVDKTSKRITCVVTTPVLSKLDFALRNDIINAAKDCLPKGYVSYVSMKNDLFTSVTYRNFFLEVLKKRFVAISNIKKDNVIVKEQPGRHFEISLTVNQVQKSLIDELDFINRYTAYNDGYTSYSVDINITVVEQDLSNEIANQKMYEQLAISKHLSRPQRYVAVSDLKVLVGKKIGGKPCYISDVREARDNCVLCGVVSEKKSMKAKNNPGIYITKFVLTDISEASMPVVVFTKLQTENVDVIKQATGKGDAEAQTVSKKNQLSNERKMKMLLGLYDGTEVVVCGKVAKSSFSGNWELTARDISMCRIVGQDNSSTLVRALPEKYLLVKPKVYQQYRQQSLIDTEDVPVPFELAGSIVFLDINATGLNPLKDKVFKLCAVKMTNGKIVESLSCTLNPECDIEQRKLSESNVSVEKLVVSPTLSEVVGDLYKFCHGCSIASFNTDKFMEMIKYYATPVGYIFDNKLIRLSDLLTRLYDIAGENKRPNMAVLAEIAKSLHVPLDSQTDCFVTAMASARCVSEISKKRSDL